MTWSSVSGKLKLVMMISAVLVTLAAGATAVPFLSGGKAATDVSPTLDLRHEERLREEKVRFERNQAEMAARSEALMRKAQVEFRAAVAKPIPPSPPRKTHRIRRYAWESPAETRARLWNVPEAETEQAVITALLRMCTSEQVGSEPDCIGIWQVLRNVRNRTCDRARIPRITECDDRGETMLSVMRRINRFALGLVPPKTARQRWISEMRVDCAKPPSYPSQLGWDRFHLRACKDTVRLASQLVRGQRRQRLTPAYIIAWGGRCEDPGGACDDPIACARGLARVPNLGTGNAFWCRPGGAAPCPEDIDPVCIEMGYRSFGTPEETSPTAVVSANSKNVQQDS